MPTVPNRTTLAIATAVSRGDAFTAGATASTAAAPHTALPAATSTACERVRRNQRVPIHVPASIVEANTTRGITTPDVPRSWICASVSRAP